MIGLIEKYMWAYIKYLKFQNVYIAYNLSILFLKSLSLLNRNKTAIITTTTLNIKSS